MLLLPADGAAGDAQPDPESLPHFDGLGRTCIAALHHLSAAESGGAAFFRHRSTGTETVDPANYPACNAAVNAEIHRLGPPKPGYIPGDTPLYEQIAFCPARFNRLMIYRGNTIHSAQVAPDTPLTDDPATGRFSINTFLWWPKA